MSLETIITIITDKVYPAILVVFFFGLTVFIHELGHFLVAKRRGMKIERFSIGFGPKIFGWVKDGIDYRVSWIPFGGYVTLPQMSPMEAIEGKTENSAAELPPASPTSKILVAVWGPVMNFLFAIPLACIVWLVGLPQPVNPSIVGYIEPGSREEVLGIRPGDHIVEVDGRPVKTWLDIQRAVLKSLETTIPVRIERDGVATTYLLETEFNKVFGLKSINLFPEGRPYAYSLMPGFPAEAAGVKVGDEFLAVDEVPVSTRQEVVDLVEKRANEEITLKLMRDKEPLQIKVIPRSTPDGKGRIGVNLDDKIDYQIVKPGPDPIKQFRDIFVLMGDTVYALFHSKQTGVGASSLSGPVGILGGWWHEIKNGGILRGVWFAVLLNLNLAIMNLLPLPVLDGGHILFSLIEAVRRKPINPRFVHATFTGCAILLISFMLYVTVFDFRRFLGFRFPSSNQPATNEPAAAPKP